MSDLWLERIANALTILFGVVLVLFAGWLVYGAALYLPGAVSTAAMLVVARWYIRKVW